MPFPIKICVLCHEEFELRPDKPGFANRCPECTEKQQAEAHQKSAGAGDPVKADPEAQAARRDAMRNLLYRKDS